MTFAQAPDAAHVVVPELTFRGADITRPFQAETPTGARCGFGPLIEIDGREYPTKVHGKMGDVVNGSPLRLVGCRTGPVDLAAGEHRLRTPSNAEFQVVQVAGVPVTADGTDPEAAREVTLLGWGDTHREAEVDAGAESVLFLPENFNPGWVATVEGEELPALRVDGWQQGWLLPASEKPVEVDLEYRPQQQYAAVLTAGLASSGLLLLAGCVLLGLLLVRRRSGARAATEWPASAGEPVKRWLLLAAPFAMLLLLGPVPTVGIIVGAVLPAGRVGRVVGASAVLIFGGAVLEAVVETSWSGRVSDVVTALAAGALAGIAFGVRR